VSANSKEHQLLIGMNSYRVCMYVFLIPFRSGSACRRASTEQIQICRAVGPWYPLTSVGLSPSVHLLDEMKRTCIFSVFFFRQLLSSAPATLPLSCQFACRHRSEDNGRCDSNVYMLYPVQLGNIFMMYVFFLKKSRLHQRTELPL